MSGRICLRACSSQTRRLPALSLRSTTSTRTAKSISEGDTSVTFAIADTGSFEDQFDAMLAKMVNPDAELIAAFRRLVW